MKRLEQKTGEGVRNRRLEGLERAMNFKGLLLLGLAICVAGCSSTLGGVKEDVSRDTHAVGSAAHHAASAVGSVARNAEDATTLTPKVKLAIIRDPLLANRGNQINVGVLDKVVYLKGHVMTARMKERAEEDAQNVLDTHHVNGKVKNELVVQP